MKVKHEFLCNRPEKLLKPQQEHILEGIIQDRTAEVIKSEQKDYKSANVLYRKYSESIKYALLQKHNSGVNVEVIGQYIKERSWDNKVKTGKTSIIHNLSTTMGSKLKDRDDQHEEHEIRSQVHILLLPAKSQVGWP